MPPRNSRLLVAQEKCRTTPRSSFRRRVILCSASSPQGQRKFGGHRFPHVCGNRPGTFRHFPTRRTPVNRSFVVMGTHNARRNPESRPRRGFRGKGPPGPCSTVSFSAEKQFRPGGGKRRLHGKMRPLPGGLIVSRVPHHSVKPRGHLAPWAHVGIRFEPDANAAGGFLLREAPSTLPCSNSFARGALQSRARPRFARPILFSPFFPPNCHSTALSLLAP